MYLVFNQLKEKSKPCIDIVSFSLLLLAIFITVAFGLMYWGYNLGISKFYAQQAQWQSTIALQKEQLQELQLKTELSLDLVSYEFGKVQAHVARIDALGLKLASIANIDAKEFNFRNSPAIGGPAAVKVSTNKLKDASELMLKLEQMADVLEQREYQLSSIEDMLLYKPAKTETENALLLPVLNAYISSEYGYRSDPFSGNSSFHKGIDFAAKKGTDIHAIADGKVTKSQYMRGYGFMIEIDHGNGIITRYAHNSKNKAKKGEKVKAGEVIALVGSTGRATGPHLHFEVIKEGSHINPREYIDAISTVAKK